MINQGMIPTPDTIPAPWGWFELLGNLTLVLHFLLMNVILGGMLLLLFTRWQHEGDPQNALSGPLLSKLPTAFALTINLGVAPLLFMQVLYGHLFYTSTVLMGVFWILIIPLLMIAYYGAYLQSHQWQRRPLLSKISTVVSALILLYISFIYSNVMTHMGQPELWDAYFQNRGGTLLNLSDPTLIPRYLHFITAAIAIAALFTAILWGISSGKKMLPIANQNRIRGLRIFAYATMAQFVVGSWFLIAQPTDIMLLFMGRDPWMTGMLIAGILPGIIAIVTAMQDRLSLTVILTLLSMVFMVISRALLRNAYTGRFFSLGDLKVVSQYDVMILFFIVFALGLAAVGYMLKVVIDTRREGASA